MRVRADIDVCEANGVCETIAPQVFRVSEELDKVEILVERPGPDLREKVEHAVRRCPKLALSILDE